MKLFNGLKKKMISQHVRDASEIEIEVSKKPPSKDERKTSVIERTDRIALLTLREKALFLLLLEGHTLKESAKQMSVKYSTANTHMTSIYKKLDVKSRAELIIHYRNAGTNSD